MKQTGFRGGSSLIHGLLAATMTLPLGHQAIAAPPVVPALEVPANAEHHVGKVIWSDLVTPDLSQAKRFYGELFGWTFRTIEGSHEGYAIAEIEGRPVAGLLQRKGLASEHKQPGWLPFLAVLDVENTERLTLQHGGKVLREPRSFPDRGRQAVFADPEGAPFAVLASTSGDPPDFLPVAGEWIWCSLLAQDVDQEAAFYQALFGYEAFVLPSPDGSEHIVLSADDYARVGANSLPVAAAEPTRQAGAADPAKPPSAAGAPHPAAHWFSFVRVDDAVASSARAVALGGRVLVEAHRDRHGDRLAVVSDPSGAPLGLMEWSEDHVMDAPK